jgi:hypothetical protein
VEVGGHRRGHNYWFKAISYGEGGAHSLLWMIQIKAEICCLRTIYPQEKLKRRSMIKPIACLGVALLIAVPVLAQPAIVDAPTSPDDPLSKTRGWVEKPPQTAIVPPAQAAGNPQTSNPRSRSTQRLRRVRDRSIALPNNSASQLNQQELGRISAGGTPQH